MSTKSCKQDDFDIVCNRKILVVGKPTKELLLKVLVPPYSGMCCSLYIAFLNNIYGRRKMLSSKDIGLKSMIPLLLLKLCSIIRIYSENV